VRGKERNRPSLRVLFVVAALFLSVLILVACDPAHDLTFKNETEGDVIIWVQNSEGDRLDPGESKTFSVLKYSGEKRFRVTDTSGQILFEDTFAYDDLPDLDTIVVTATAP
jgi:hypothetical protein